MSKLVAIFCLMTMSVSSYAKGIDQIKKPTGVKVNAVFNSWEKIYTPNLCYPDAVVFKVQMTKNTDFKQLAFAAAKEVNKDAVELTSFVPLTSDKMVEASVKSALTQMGMSDSPELTMQLFRVYQKSDVRKVFTLTVTKRTDRVELTGEAIVIADLETNELVLLTYGETFDVSRCSQ